MKSALKPNKLWSKEKPSKEFKKWYKETYGLVAKDIYIPNSKLDELMESLYLGKKK